MSPKSKSQTGNNNPSVTLKSIAEKVGVSPSTVSRVLSGKARPYRISKETEEAVQRVANDLEYTPDQLARGLRLKRTHTIGLVIPDISNPFFASVARSIEIEARKVSYSIILCDTQEETKLEIDSLRLLQSRKVDGLIICPAGQESEHLKPLCSNGIALVIVDRCFSDLRCSNVVSDNYGGSVEAVCHFFEKNHRIIGFIQGLLNTSVNNDRVRGYKDAHKTHNIPIDESLIVGDSFGEGNGYIGAKLLLNRSPQPTAIFTASNLISLGALRAISEEGLKIPDDISMISFDDQPYSDYLSTPMTTVAQQTTEMGQIAFKLLMDQIDGKKASEKTYVVLPAKLILRKSVTKLDVSSKLRKKEEVLNRAVNR